MNRFSPRALEYLNAIDRFGTLRKAAVRLSVDPSAISRLLSQLEQDIGMPVWERRPPHAQITQAGHELLDYYRQMQASEEATLSRLNALQNLNQGRVSLAVGEGFIADLISQPLQNFLAEYPGIELSIEMAGASEALRLIESYQIDFAITYASTEAPFLHTHVEIDQPLNLIVPPGHPLGKSAGPVDFRETADFASALIDRSTGMGRLISTMEEVTRTPLMPKLRTNSVSVLKNFVTSGIGISFMPSLTVHDEIKAGLIQAVPIDHSIMQRAQARLVSHNQREPTLAAQTLMQYLHHNMQFLRRTM